MLTSLMYNIIHKTVERLHRQPSACYVYKYSQQKTNICAIPSVQWESDLCMLQHVV